MADNRHIDNIQYISIYMYNILDISSRYYVSQVEYIQFEIVL